MTSETSCRWVVLIGLLYGLAEQWWLVLQSLGLYRGIARVAVGSVNNSVSFCNKIRQCCRELYALVQAMA